MKIYLPDLEGHHDPFPPHDHALSDPDGLLAMGGDLSPGRLLTAYSQGIFPWYSAGEPILWWSPANRAVFDPKTFKPSKSLKKFVRKNPYQVSVNRATDEVIRLCAETRGPEETWLLPEMREAYLTLADLGRVHSVEVWLEDSLAGGLYGVSVGQVFCGESMFSLATNASKTALWYFCDHFSAHGGQLIDCQVMNDHLCSLGAQSMHREDFLARLRDWKDQPLAERCFQPQALRSPLTEEPHE